LWAPTPRPRGGPSLINAIATGRGGEERRVLKRQRRSQRERFLGARALGSGWQLGAPMWPIHSAGPDRGRVPAARVREPSLHSAPRVGGKARWPSRGSAQNQQHHEFWTFRKHRARACMTASGGAGYQVAARQTQCWAQDTREPGRSGRIARTSLASLSSMFDVGLRQR
jgi:hypothetical protein